MRTSKEQEDLVCKLKEEGVKHRDISEQVFGNRSGASTVHYILKRRGLVGVKPKDTLQSHTGTPKVLVFDIETAPILASLWSMWQQGIGLSMIKNDWFVLSWSAKWLGEDEVMYEDLREEYQNEDDSNLLRNMWRLLDEADMVITQNGKKFDVKKLNARFIINGFQPPSSYKHIDTLEIAKRKFGFTSNKLEYMTDKLCVKYKKLKHGKFPGFELWKECLVGNIEAWDEMEEYNRYDVLSLEELYYILRPWDNKHPNFNLYQDDVETTCRCGSSKLAKDGFAYTNLSKFQRYRCTDCGAESRGRTNLLDKEQRKKLHMNIG